MNLPKKIFLVTHDWGAVLGFHWANQHRDRVAGIAFSEGLVEPAPDYDFYDEDTQKGLKVFSPIVLPSIPIHHPPPRYSAKISCLLIRRKINILLYLLSVW